jgi:(p)ppGpp synthase/HD superfamily hydrolase
MPDIDDALSLAVKAHKGQKDKAGKAYILHPLRLMAAMETDAEMMTAILHDVVEDTNITIEELRNQEYPEEVLAALDGVTRRDGESYNDFIKRVSDNTISKKVKIADLEDNMNITRLNVIGEKDMKRLGKYLRAWRYLQGTEGNSGSLLFKKSKKGQ